MIMGIFNPAALTLSKRMKILLAFAAAILLMAGLSGGARACTTIIVGRDVSTDGSRIIARNSDNHGLDVTLVTNTKAETRSEPWTYTSGFNGFTMELPAASSQYISTPLAPSLNEGIWAEAAMNQYGVGITATESIYGSDAALAADPLVEKGLDECSIPTVVIPYVTTAREGVERIGAIVDEKGSSESNAIVIADQNETWYMEIYTGHQWAAIRFPDDAYAVIGNDGMLGTIDPSDTQNVITSKDLFSLAQDKGFAAEKDGQFNLALSYCEPHRDYSQIRVWAAQRKWSPSQSSGYDMNRTYDLLMKPDNKISLADVMEMTRYRYEDTAYNVNDNPAIRAIGINRTQSAHILWMRDNKPGVLWSCLANPEMSVYLPIYANTASFPAQYGLDKATYTRDSAYFKFRSLSALAVQDREKYGAPVRAHWKQMETDLIANMDAMDAQYEASGRSGEEAAVLFAGISTTAMADADALYDQTLTSVMNDSVQDGSSDVSADNPIQTPDKTSMAVGLAVSLTVLAAMVIWSFAGNKKSKQ